MEKGKVKSESGKAILRAKIQLVSFWSKADLECGGLPPLCYGPACRGRLAHASPLSPLYNSALRVSASMPGKNRARRASP
jgi:hypothetical protein